MTQAHVLIGGINRSGTSLMRQLLGSHSSVAIPPTEFGFFENALVRGSRRHSQAQLVRIADDLLNGAKVRAWGLDPAPVRARAAAARNLRDVFTAFLEEYARMLGKPCWGEKTTHYERHLSTLDDWFGTDYVFVHLVRHPVAAFASTRHYGGEHGVDAAQWAWTWKRSAATALRAVWHPRRRSHLLVRYEDLVREPERVLRDVCTHADLDYDADMLEMRDFEVNENSSFELKAPVYLGGIRVIDATRRSDHVRPEEIRQIMRVCGSTARLLGYDIPDERVLAAISARRRVGSPLDGGYAVFRAKSLMRRSISPPEKPAQL